MNDSTSPATETAGATQISCSRGFAGWLASQAVSLALSSYQTGQLILIGRSPQGDVSFHRRDFVRAMGLWAEADRLFIAARQQIWRLENVLAPDELANGIFDRLYVPRAAEVTGDLDIHEIGRDVQGRLIFVNTKYSCLATVSTTHAFRPLWKPRFISRLAAEDRCHLNGLCLDAGRPRYVTAVARTDVVDGWRSHRAGGGVVIDLANDAVVAEDLSMPHSPRLYQGQLYVLDSGRGMLVRLDPSSGARAEIAFCPGFLRGLSFHAGHAIVTLSLPRDSNFAGLPLQEAIARRGGEPWCGIQIINLGTGDIVHWVRFEGMIRELFDVVALPGVRCPMAAPSQGPDFASVITMEGPARDLDAPG